MRFSVLGSGSRGNAVYIEHKNTGLLIDAGFSGKELTRRLSQIGGDLSRVRGICITHEHNDHIQGAGVLSRRGRIPVYVNEATLVAGEKKFGRLHSEKIVANGSRFAVGDLEIRSFRISHDCADPVGYTISDGKTTLGYCTDTGKISHLMAQRLAGCDGLVLEFNHNLKMLQDGPYPLPLQQRVRSSQGHLSNEDAASFLKDFIDKRLRRVVLAHLSEVNNTPQLALQSVENMLFAEGRPELHVALQHQPTPLFAL